MFKNLSEKYVVKWRIYFTAWTIFTKTFLRSVGAISYPNWLKLWVSNIIIGIIIIYKYTHVYILSLMLRVSLISSCYSESTGLCLAVVLTVDLCHVGKSQCCPLANGWDIILQVVVEQRIQGWHGAPVGNNATGLETMQQVFTSCMQHCNLQLRSLVWWKSDSFSHHTCIDYSVCVFRNIYAVARVKIFEQIKQSICYN